MAFFFSEPPNGAGDQSGQLVGRTVNRLMQGRRVMGDRNWLMVTEPGFHSAAHIFWAGLWPVLISQMNFHSRDALTDMLKRTLHDATYMGRKCLAARNVVVGIDLDLHRNIHDLRSDAELAKASWIGLGSGSGNTAGLSSAVVVA